MPVIRGPALENLTAAIVKECRSGLDTDTLRTRVLPRLRRAVPVDAVWWATVDPATLLFTQDYREAIPPETGPYFVDNEFLRDDVNKWTDLARQRADVATLVQATAGRVEESPRYLDIFRPLGLEDELRAVLRTRGTCWGYICLHRETGRPFSDAEITFVRRIAPYVGDAVRVALLIRSVELASSTDAPGLILLADGHAASRMNDAAALWLQELSSSQAGSPLPIEIYAVAAKLRSMSPSEGATPRLRVRTRTGRWAVLHATWLPAEGEDVVAVMIEEAQGFEVAPVIMAAYGLTERERAVSGLVCRGLSTAEITTLLRLSSNTLQDHLKSIFMKTGVSSRRELAATILRRDYIPRGKSGQTVGRSGFYV